MYKTYEDMVNKAKNKNLKLSVAAAQDSEVISAIKKAYDLKIAEPILFGDENKIKEIMKEQEIKDDFKIVNCLDDKEASLKAVESVRVGESDILMKGILNSSDFLRPALDSNKGIKAGKLISHLGAFEIKGEEKIIFMADGGVNVQPNLEEKREILLNSMNALGNMGMDDLKVAILAANEKVSDKIPATKDARELVEMREEGIIPKGIIEGPIALDVAISKEAAEHKNIKSKVSGEVDLFIVPNIESGNIFGKSLIYYGQAKMAGIILGFNNPVVMTSRSETAENKLNSIAMAVLAY